MNLTAINLGFQRTLSAQRYLLLLGPLMLLPGVIPVSRELWGQILCYMIVPFWALGLAASSDEEADRLWLGFGQGGTQLLGRVLTQQAVVLGTAAAAGWGLAGMDLGTVGAMLLVLSAWQSLAVMLRSALGKSGVLLAPFFAAAAATVAMEVAIWIPFSDPDAGIPAAALAVALAALSLAWWFEAQGGTWALRFARQRSLLLVFPLLVGGLGAGGGSLIPTDRQGVLSVAPDADLALLQDCGWCLYQDSYRVSLLGPNGATDAGLGPVRAAMLGPRGAMVWVPADSGQLHARLGGTEVACAVWEWPEPMDGEFSADGGSVEIELGRSVVLITPNGCFVQSNRSARVHGTAVAGGGASSEVLRPGLPSPDVRGVGPDLLQHPDGHVSTTDGTQRWEVPGPLIAARREGDQLIGWTRSARVIGVRVP